MTSHTHTPPPAAVLQEEWDFGRLRGQVEAYQRPDQLEPIGSADLEDTEHLLGPAAAVTPLTDDHKELGPGPCTNC